MSTDPFAIRCAGWTASALMRIIYHTSRKQFLHLERLSDLLEADQQVIIASWHNRLLQSVFIYLKANPGHRRLVPIASASKDGGIAAHAMAGLGLTCVRGSSNRKGISAFKAMMREARDGADIAFTPDGPKGPLYHIHDGVLTAARMTGAPIVPISYQAKRCKRLNSWDRLILPAPFNQLRLGVGEPFYVPRKLDEGAMDQLAKQLHESMRALDQELAFPGQDY